MDLFEFALLSSGVLVLLVAGIVLTFAIVVMPGIASMDDRGFLHAFKVMDRVIQNNHPVFMFVWLGSIGLLLLAVGLGLFALNGMERVVLIAVGVLYLFGVMVPTVRINVPLNNELQRRDLDTLSIDELSELRLRFESTWNRWNVIRSIVAIVTGVAILVLLLRV